MPYNFTPSMDGLESIGSKIKRWLHGYFINLNADTTLTTGAGSKVGFYGAAPVAQRASNAELALTPANLYEVGTLYGFSSGAALTSIYAFCNEVQVCLTSIGAWKGSA